MRTMKVGELAGEAGINPETMRYYERIGLMPEPRRKESRYRCYGEADLARVKFIVRCKELGFTLKETDELLSMRADSDTKCEDVKELALRKVAEIRKRIEDLESISAHLQSLVSRCTGGRMSMDDCPVVNALDGGRKGEEPG